MDIQRYHAYDIQLDLRVFHRHMNLPLTGGTRERINRRSRIDIDAFVFWVWAKNESFANTPRVFKQRNTEGAWCDNLGKERHNSISLQNLGSGLEQTLTS